MPMRVCTEVSLDVSSGHTVVPGKCVQHCSQTVQSYRFLHSGVVISLKYTLYSALGRKSLRSPPGKVTLASSAWTKLIQPKIQTSAKNFAGASLSRLGKEDWDWERDIGAASSADITTLLALIQFFLTLLPVLFLHAPFCHVLPLFPSLPCPTSSVWCTESAGMLQYQPRGVSSSAPQSCALAIKDLKLPECQYKVISHCRVRGLGGRHLFPFENGDSSQIFIMGDPCTIQTRRCLPHYYC